MNLVSPERTASAIAASRESPRFRTVSIIPGIETGAPERTESSSGSGPAPNVFPVAASIAARRPCNSSTSPSGSARRSR